MGKISQLIEELGKASGHKYIRKIGTGPTAQYIYKEGEKREASSKPPSEETTDKQKEPVSEAKFRKKGERVSSSELQVGMVVTGEYNLYNEGAEDFTIKGFKVGDKKYTSIKEMLKDNGASSLGDLRKKIGTRDQGEVRLLTTDVGSSGEDDFYYLSGSRWARGSGAEPFTFTLLKDHGQETPAKKHDKPTNIKKEDYDWGTYRHVEVGSGYGIPIHPEHWGKIQETHKTGKTSNFKDETGKTWKVEPHKESGVVLSHENKSVHLDKENLKKLSNEKESKQKEEEEHPINKQLKKLVEEHGPKVLDEFYARFKDKNIKKSIDDYVVERDRKLKGKK